MWGSNWNSESTAKNSYAASLRFGCGARLCLTLIILSGVAAAQKPGPKPVINPPQPIINPPRISEYGTLPVTVVNNQNSPSQPPKAPDDNCLLPPLNHERSAHIAAT